FDLIQQEVIDIDSPCSMGVLPLTETKRPVTGDSRKPCREFRRIVNRRQRLEREQERILRYVFRIFAADDALCGTHHCGAITQCQLVERIEVAEYRRYDKDFIRRLCAYLGHPLSILPPS